MANLDPRAALEAVRSLNLSAFGPGDDALRQSLLLEVHRLAQRLETPEETIRRMTFHEPTLNLALRIADEMDLFTGLGPAGGPPVNIQALAAPKSADPELVKRVMRHIAAKGVATEHPGDAYGPTALTVLLATSEGFAPLRCVAHKFHPIFQDVPTYLRSVGFTVPRDARDGPFQHSALGKVGQTHFEWLATPEAAPVAADFNLLMRFGARSEGAAGQRAWTDALDTAPLVKGLDGADSNPPPAMVDVGGNLGHNSAAFRAAHPEAAAARVVVQDLPHVVEQALASPERPASVDFEAHSFFDAQPLTGARVYFMGHVLHDWPDSEARVILRHLAAAMTRGFSTLVLREKVLPSVGCDPFLSAIDMIMMAELASHERSDAQWAELLATEGLRLTGVHPIPSSVDSVLLAELA